MSNPIRVVNGLSLVWVLRVGQPLWGSPSGQQPGFARLWLPSRFHLCRAAMAARSAAV